MFATPWSPPDYPGAVRTASLLVLVVFALAACGGGGSDEGLADLASVDELRTQFNEDRGEPRLLLILAPT